MKIGFLTPEFPHEKTGSSGGIGTSIFNLAKGLVQLNHQVFILIYGQDKDEVFEENGISFYKIKNIKIKGLSLFLTQKKVERLINKLYIDKKIDLIEAPDWTGFTSFIQPKCPVIIKIHGSDTYFCHLDKRPVKKINKFHEKRALMKANGIISVSKYAGDLTNKVFNLTKKFTVIHNAIDYNQFETSNVNNEKSILYFGTLIQKKGLFELPYIFNEVYKKDNQIKLILIGKDSPDKLSGSASTWQMCIPLFNKDAFQNVSYIGSVPYKQMKNQIQKASVCVFPSFAEALPVSWLEAMSMQKPVVGSNVGWACEIIDDSIDGFLVNPKEHELYANRIIEVLSNNNLQIQLGIEARKKIIEKFSIEIVAKKSVEMYQKML